jgi:hypothetical protein
MNIQQWTDSSKYATVDIQQYEYTVAATSVNIQQQIYHSGLKYKPAVIQ